MTAEETAAPPTTPLCFLERARPFKTPSKRHPPPSEQWHRSRHGITRNRYFSLPSSPFLSLSLSLSLFLFLSLSVSLSLSLLRAIRLHVGSMSSVSIGNHPDERRSPRTAVGEPRPVVKTFDGSTRCQLSLSPSFSLFLFLSLSLPLSLPFSLSLSLSRSPEIYIFDPDVIQPQIRERRTCTVRGCYANARFTSSVVSGHALRRDYLVHGASAPLASPSRTVHAATSPSAAALCCSAPERRYRRVCVCVCVPRV